MPLVVLVGALALRRAGHTRRDERQTTPGRRVSRRVSHNGGRRAAAGRGRGVVPVRVLISLFGVPVPNFSQSGLFTFSRL